MKNVAALMIAAAVFMGIYQYPAAAQWITDLNSRGELVGYGQAVEQAPEDLTRSISAQATQYNQELANRTLKLSSVADDARYRETLAIDGSMYIARISIPRLKVYLGVQPGTSDAVLAKSAGHFYGSSLPVGGESTHAVITAHSGLVNSHMFTNLEEAVVGDLVTVQSLGETLWYRVYDIQSVLPDELDNLLIQHGRDLVTFVTCTPIGINTHRLLVMAERVERPENAAVTQELRFWEYPGTPWWAVKWSATVLAAGMLARFVLVPYWKRAGERAVAKAKKKRLASTTSSGIKMQPVSA
jgi:sortase A